MHKSHFKIIAILLIVFVAGATTAQAGSIYSKAAKRTKSLYSDHKAAAVGDILTIVINERTKIDEKSDRTMESSSERTMEADINSLGVGRALDKLTGGAFDLDSLDASTSGSKKFDGKTAFGRDSSIEDEITVVVEDVLPNGNLVILGKRVREIEGEKQLIQVSGIVRPRDIDYTNKITSTRVANYHMVHKHTGRENRFTKPGWLGRILNFISPF